MNSTQTDPKPFYRLHVFVCTNRRPDGHSRGSCAARGSEAHRDYLKVRAKELGLKNVRINSAGCLDRCELGPVLVVYPDGIWYRYETSQDLDDILTNHLLHGQRVQHLLLHPEDGLNGVLPSSR